MSKKIIAFTIFTIKEKIRSQKYILGNYTIDFNNNN